MAVVAEIGVPVYLAVAAFAVAVLALVVAVTTRDRRTYQAGARIDRDTGIAARAAWEAAVGREIARSRRYGQPFCVALVDLEHAPDLEQDRDEARELLRDVAQAWKRQLRETDLIARVGQSRFGVLLIGCLPAEARIAVDRVRAATPPRHWSAAGVACWNGSEPTHAMVARAEQGLARAKRAGGATIVVQSTPGAGGPPPPPSPQLSAPPG
jgi:diguanylate cyclase (GGDEF)-like protein